MYCNTPGFPAAFCGLSLMLAHVSVTSPRLMTTTAMARPLAFLIVWSASLWVELCRAVPLIDNTWSPT